MNLQRLSYTRTGRTFLAGFFKENAVCYQLLGLCSALAVSNKLENAIAMGLGVVFVLTVSSSLVSMLRRFIPTQYRLISYMIITATFVIIVDQFLRAMFPAISSQLGPYVGLIITNCVVMGRQEAFAIKNGVWQSLVDGLGSSLSYFYTLAAMAVVRELLGFGTLLNVRVMPAGFERWVVISMAQGAWFVLAVFYWVFRRAARLQPAEEG